MPWLPLHRTPPRAMHDVYRYNRTHTIATSRANEMQKCITRCTVIRDYQLNTSTSTSCEKNTNIMQLSSILKQRKSPSSVHKLHYIGSTFKCRWWNCQVTVVAKTTASITCLQKPKQPKKYTRHDRKHHHLIRNHKLSIYIHTKKKCTEKSDPMARSVRNLNSESSLSVHSSSAAFFGAWKPLIQKLSYSVSRYNSLFSATFV